ncbi:hypothetical protein RQP46_002648 [Phenoliferia psychrophenolica]
MGKSSKRTLDAEAAPSSDAAAAPVAEAMEVDEPVAKKSKKDKDGDKEVKEVPVEALSAIAKPLAGKKAGKKVLKLVKKASKSRHLKRGVKEVVKSVRKGEKGIIVLAADISPVDILTHIPLLAEEANCPYIWVTSKEALGLASSTKRPTSCVMVAKVGMKKKVKEGETEKEGLAEVEAEFQELYTEMEAEVAEL